MPPAAERLEVFLIWGSSDRRNSHAGEQVRVDLLAEPRIETLEALADRAKLEFCMEARPQLLHTRTFNPIESMAELINKGDVVVVPPDEKGVMLPIKPKLMCNVINTAKNGATATVALQELIENCIEAIRRVAPGHLGSITIDVAYDPETKTFTITIRDNGFGINSSEIERVVTFGYSKHENKAKDQEHRDPLALDGFFGKYGIGFKSSFVFGEEVQIDLRSKQAGEKVAYAVLNWQEMQRSDGEYVANIGVEEHTLGAVTNEHWTEVKISNVDYNWGTQLLERRNYPDAVLGISEGFEWKFKKAVKQELADKYCFFINGYDEIRPWMHAEPWKETFGEGGDSPGKISFTLAGESLDQEATECKVWKRVQAFCKEPEELVLIQTLHLKDVPKRVFAYVVFKFVPIENDPEAEADNVSLLRVEGGPKMMGFWAGMLLPRENFQGGQIPWAHAANVAARTTNRAKPECEAIVQSFKRVIGMVFFCTKLPIDIHKLHIGTEMANLFQECSTSYNYSGPPYPFRESFGTLKDEYDKKVLHWFETTNRGFTFKGGLGESAVRIPGDPDTRTYFRWKEVVVPGSCSAKKTARISGGDFFSYHATIHDPGAEREGSVVRVISNHKATKHVLGRIVHIETLDRDHAKQGHVILSFGCGKDPTKYLEKEDFKYDVSKILGREKEKVGVEDQLREGVAKALPCKLLFNARPAAGLWTVDKATLLATTFNFTICSKEMPEGIIFPDRSPFKDWKQHSSSSYFLYKGELAKFFYLVSRFWEIDDAGKRVRQVQVPHKKRKNDDYLLHHATLSPETGALSFNFCCGDPGLFLHEVASGTFECEFTVDYDWAGHPDNKNDPGGKGLSESLYYALNAGWASLKQTIRIKISPGAPTSMELELPSSSELHFGSEVPLLLSIKDKNGEMAAVLKVQDVQLNFQLGENPNRISGSITVFTVSVSSPDKKWSVKSGKMPEGFGRRLVAGEVKEGVKGKLTCSAKVTFKIGDAPEQYVTLTQSTKIRVRSGLPHRIEIAGLEAFQNSIYAGAALDRDLSAQSFSVSVLDRWDNVFRGVEGVATLDISFSLDNCKFGVDQDREDLTEISDLQVLGLYLDFAAGGGDTQGSVVVKCELTGSLRESVQCLSARVDFRVCSRQLRFSTPPHDKTTDLISLPHEAAWDLPEIRLAVVDVDDLDKSVMVVALGALCQLQIKPLPPGAKTVTRSTIVLNERLPSSVLPHGFSANQANQIQEFVEQQGAGRKCTGRIECVASYLGLKARLDIDVAAGPPCTLEAFDVERLQKLQVGETFKVSLRLLGKLFMPVESSILRDFDISMRLVFEGEDFSASMLEPMQHSAKGASSVLKRKLPVRTDGSVREARLEICADPREGGAPIYCNNLEECPVCFRAGPLARLEFRREAGAEAVGAWNYVSGDRFPLRVFAVDEFGHVDTSYFSDVRVSYDHGGSTHEFTLKMQDGIVELEPLFVGVAEQAAIQIVAEAQRKRGGLQGKLNLTVQPGAWLRRPVFHPTDGGELRQGEDGPDGVLESSVEVEEFLALGVKGEAWDGSDVRLDAAAIRITHPGNVPPTQKIIQGGGLQFRFLVPAAPAVYEFGMFFPGGGGVEIERGLKVERLQGDVNLRMTSLDGLHPGKLIRSGESLKIQVQKVTTLGHVCGSLDRRDLRFACEPAGVTVTAVAGKVRGTISLTVDDSEKEMNDVVSCKIFASSATSKDAAFLEFKYYPRFLVESETADTNRDRQRQAAKVELQKAETVLKRAVDALEGKAREVAARELPNIDAIAAQNFPELDWGAVDVIRHCEQAIVKGEEDKAELTRDGRDRQLAVEEIRGDAPLSRKLLLENNAGGINVTMPANCLGVVADFGWIDRAEEKFAPAVAALGGADLSALVFQTQREAQEWEQTAPTDELKGLRFIALDSCKEAEGISEDLWKKFARFNVQGKADFAMDIIKYDEHAMPGSGKLWQHVLGSALIFDRHDDLLTYQEQFGIGQVFVSRHPTRGWKLGGRVLARVGAAAAREFVEFIAPDATLRFKDIEKHLVELERTTSDLKTLQQDADNKRQQKTRCEQEVARLDPPSNPASGGRPLDPSDDPSNPPGPSNGGSAARRSKRARHS